MLIILLCWITDSGADFCEFCTGSCAGFERVDPLCGVCISYACVTGEDKAIECRAVETGGGGEGKARPEKELGAE